MTRIGVVPVVGLMLAIASCGGLLLLQGRDGKSHDAQLALVRVENNLNQLQGLPWEIQNPQFGTPGAHPRVDGQNGTEHPHDSRAPPPVGAGG